MNVILPLKIFEYEVSYISVSGFLTELQYRLNIQYISDKDFKFSLKPLKTATNFLLLQNYVSIYNQNELLHLDASPQQAWNFPPLLPFQTPNVAILLTLYMNDKVDPFILKFKSSEERDEAMKHLPRQPLPQNLIDKFKSSISVKDRAFGLKIYQKCFIGSEATRSIMSIWKTTRINAVWIGRRMQQELQLFDHVSKDQVFKDRYLFYRFFDSGVKSTDSKDFFNDIYHGFFGGVDSTFRTVASITKTDVVLDFAISLKESAKDIAIDTTNFAFEETAKVVSESIKFFEPDNTSVEQNLFKEIQDKEFDLAIQNLKTIYSELSKPEKMREVPSILKSKIEAKNALREKLVNLLQSQSNQARTAKNLIVQSNSYMEKNFEEFDQIAEIVKQKESDISSFPIIKDINRALGNLILTKNWINRMMEVQEEFLALQYVIKDEYDSLDLKYNFNINEEEAYHAYKKLRTSLNLLDIHLRIRSLSEFKLKALLELNQNKNLLNIFENFFKNVDILNQQFISIMASHFENIIIYASESLNSKVIEIVRIIEREEKYEEEIKFRASPQIIEKFQEKKLRNLFFESIKKNVRTTIRKEISKLSLGEKLEKLEESIDDLTYIKEYIKDLFPPNYNLMQFYIECYENEIFKFISKKTKDLDKLSNGDNTLITEFLMKYDTFFDEAILDEIINPRDYSKLIKDLNNKFENNVSLKLFDFSDNIIQIILSDKLQPIEYEGGKFSTGPSDLMKTIYALFEQAQKRQPVAAKLVSKAIQVFKFYSQNFYFKVKQKMKTLSVSEICLFINDFELLLEYKEDLYYRCKEITYAMNIEDLEEEINEVNQDLVKYQKDLIFDLIKVIKEETTEFANSLKKSIVKGIKDVFQDLKEFTEDMSDVFRDELYSKCLVKIDLYLAETSIQIMLVDEALIIETSMDTLIAISDYSKKIFSILNSSETIDLYESLIDLLSSMNSVESATESINNFLLRYPDIKKEILFSLIKRAKKGSKDIKKDLEKYIDTLFEKHTPKKSSLLKNVYPVSFKPKVNKNEQQFEELLDLFNKRHGDGKQQSIQKDNSFKKGIIPVIEPNIDEDEQVDANALADFLSNQNFGNLDLNLKFIDSDNSLSSDDE